MEYLVNATLTIELEDVTVHLDKPASGEGDFRKALLQKLHKQLAFLDIKGGRTGDDGVISTIECESIDNWSAT